MREGTVRKMTEKRESTWELQSPINPFILIQSRDGLQTNRGNRIVRSNGGLQ